MPYRHPLFALRLYSRLRVLQVLCGAPPDGAFTATRRTVAAAVRRGLREIFSCLPVMRINLSLHRADQPIFEASAILISKLGLMSGEGE